MKTTMKDADSILRGRDITEYTPFKKEMAKSSATSTRIQNFYQLYNFMDMTNEEYVEEFDAKFYYEHEERGLTYLRNDVVGWLRTTLEAKDKEAEERVREERERIIKSLDWRNRTDGTQFHDGDDVVDWYDKKIQALTPTKTDKQEVCTICHGEGNNGADDAQCLNCGGTGVEDKTTGV